MIITDALLGEHAVFYAQFDYLEQSLPTADSLPRCEGTGSGPKTPAAGH